MSLLPDEGPGSVGVVLLHSPLGTAREWGRLPDLVADRGGRVVVADTEGEGGPPYAGRYVARAALQIAEGQGGGHHPAGRGGSVLLVASGAAGPLVPPVGAAQRAAHRTVAGYVLLDALLPQSGGASWGELVAAQLGEDPGDIVGLRSAPADFAAEATPMPQDWPDAPCWYLLTDPRYARCAELARLRGWSVTELTDRDTTAVADTLVELARR